MNKPKKYDDKRIKSLLKPRLKKEMNKKTIFISDEVKHKLNIDSPNNFFEVEFDQQAVFEEVEKMINAYHKLKDYYNE